MPSKASRPPRAASVPAEVRDGARALRIHFLDMGARKFGDCIVCELGETRILIDGGHPADWRSNPASPLTLSIPRQLGEVLQQESGPYAFDLLIVTHTHGDHIGCLPALVEQGQITAKWALVADPDLGYGGDGGADTAALPEPMRLVLPALREESYGKETDPATLWEFLLDAGRQQSSYREMIETLRQRRTRVVTFLGSDDERREYRQLVEAFQPAGLRILGPTRRHLEICADFIARRGRDAVDAVQNTLRRDDSRDTARIYRDLADSLDASGASLGAAINDQSLVASVEAGGRKILLTGDMQLAQPGIPGLGDEMDALRREIASRAPYDLVKIAHHASENALDESVLDDFGATPWFAISTGRDPRDAHPAPKVMRLLDQRRDHLEWARTDRNGLISFDFNRDPVRVVLTGNVNDPSLNGRDDLPAPTAGAAVVPPAPPPLPAPLLSAPPVPAAAVPLAAVEPQVVEITARIPHTATRVTITVDVQPQLPAGAATVITSGRRSLPGDSRTELRLGGGRPLPPLLFVASRPALASRIGETSADTLLRSLRDRGMVVADLDPGSLADAATAAKLVRDLLARQAGRIQGVVLIGNYDVIPSQRYDCLDPPLQAQVREAVSRGKAQQDPDNFLVWSDDIYGDADDSGFPDLPVSRIPDSGADLLWAALQAGPAAFPGLRCGVRNVRRPFADAIFSLLPAAGEMRLSEPLQFMDQPPFELSAEYIYLMLHGDYRDASYFIGESTGEWPRAIGLQNVVRAEGAVVFAGCCWGALPVAQPAAKAPPGQPLTPHTAETSLALRFLAAGARAFVGCTGVHYSPGTRPAVPHFGSPLHEAFWRACGKGSPPAKALWEAKVAYLSGMPHGLVDAAAHAVEYKTLRQFTCLGLGW